MVSAVTKKNGTTFIDFFNSVPLGIENSESARSLWQKSGMGVSYDTYNRIVGKLAVVEHNGVLLIHKKRIGASFIYWRELETFPTDLRCIE